MGGQFHLTGLQGPRGKYGSQPLPTRFTPTGRKKPVKKRTRGPLNTVRPKVLWEPPHALPGQAPFSPHKKENTPFCGKGAIVSNL